MASLSSPLSTSAPHLPQLSPSLNYPSSSSPSPSPTPSINSPRPPPPVRRASTSSERIPIPGKSILKKPPPPPTGLFSRITSGMSIGKLFGGTTTATAASPNPDQTMLATMTAAESNSGSGGLKRAHFILPHMAVVYPISSNAPPRTPMTDVEKKAVEDRERERRKRVVCGEPESGSGWWTMEKVDGFYRECCKASDVKPEEVISQALLKPSSSMTMLSTNATSTLSSVPVPAPVSTSTSPPRTLDLTGISLTTTQAEILADVLSIEWGLRSLVLCESNLDPEVLKPILHALLLNNTLIYLSVASNTGLGNKSLAGRDIGAGYGLGAGLKGAGVAITGGGGLGLGGIGGGGAVTGWVVLEAYLSNSRLKVLDLSRNVIDKKAMEGVVRGGLGSSSSYTTTEGTTSPSSELPSNSSASSSLISLTLDSVTLKSGALDVLARAVRISPSLRTLSLRNCRIGAMGSRGGIAISLMIRDWPDTVAAPPSSSTFSSNPTNNNSSDSLSEANSTIPQTQTQNNTGSLNRLRRPAALTNLLDEAVGTSSSLSSSALPSARSSLSAITMSPLQTPVPVRKPLLSPPRHLQPVTVHSSSVHPPPPNVQTTYTPYVPRSKRGVAAGSGSIPPTPNTPNMPMMPGTPMAPVTPMAPTLATVSRGGITAFSAPFGDSPSSTSNSSDSSSNYPTSTITPTTINALTHNHAGSTLGSQPVPPSVAALNSASAALLSQVRALDALPRIGSLRSLDLRGNEMRNHITYLAQVLKRNRTLKSLNLQDNKLDPKALAVLAEALKYNAALEELDLGRNACCGAIGGTTSQTGSSSTKQASTPYPNLPNNLNAIHSRSSLHPASSNIMHNHTHPSSLSNSSTLPSSQPPNQHINLSLEGIHALRLALALNATLTRLSLADTHLGDAGAIALAEWMGEYRGLRWLDLTRNSRSNSDPSSGGRETTRMGANGAGEGLGEAGVLALAQGVKVNRTLRCLDVEVPPGVEGYARLSREILNTCIRNVEASAREHTGAGFRDTPDERKSRLGEVDGDVTKDPINLGRECVEEMKRYLHPTNTASANSATTLLSSSTPSPEAPPPFLDNAEDPEQEPNIPFLLHRTRTVLEELAGVIGGLLEDRQIESSVREEKIKEVLELSDEIGILVGRVEKGEIMEGSHKERREQIIFDSEGIVFEKTKAKPALHVKVPSNLDSNPSVSSSSTSPTLSTAIDSPATITSPPSANMTITNGIFAISDSPPSTSPRNSSSPVFAVQPRESSIPHSSTFIIDTPSNISHSSEVNEKENLPSSPRRKDKGKARAPPEPVRHGPVLSPTAVLLRNGVRGASGALLLNGDMEAESEVESESGEEENDGGGEVEREDGDARSGKVWDGEAEAGVRSRSWVAEEGEVFRKGNVLLGPEEMEGEYDGEELRRELLEAMVERPAPRSLHIDDTDEYGSILTPSPLSPTSTPISSTPLSTPLTPVIPPPASSLTPSSSLFAPATTSLVSLPEHAVVTVHSGTTPTQDHSFTFRETPSLTSLSAVVEPPAVRPYIPRTRSTSSTTASAVQNTSG
ncbi:hypothetical protein DFJ43DRAFT_1072791 [Lentinula guzmanii]|uniref:RNI-like protein n=1 Tax=Lentinula guzmanii TaxID=2804957 RepID=A0AA38JAY3_9AGAR|nr:hypothetical protein DFJ43DRAFT_1072791 [Lentinula guzmanii]